MTEQEKNKIKQLRNEGLSYQDIAIQLNLSRNTVSSFLRRIKQNETEIAGVCKFCAASFIPRSGNRIKHFCSDKCRMEWWKRHKEKMKANLEIKHCIFCGREFETYKSRNKKYCSRECYLEHMGGNDGKN